MQEMRDNKFQLQPANLVNTYAIGYDNIGAFVQEVTSSVDKKHDEVPEDDRKAVASSKLRLLIGASIVNEIRDAVKAQTKYECSAGIAHNKILAKLTCGMNKPNKQTILPIESVPALFQDLAVNQVKSLGGKLGEEVCAKLNVKTMADLLEFSESELQGKFQNRVGSWLYWMSRGIDLEKVTPKFMSKSIAVSKNFRGKNEISSTLTLKFWLKELAKEIVERLEKDAVDCNRSAKQLIVTFTQGDVSSSRTVSLNGSSLNSFTAEQIADEAFDTIRKNSTKFLKAEGVVIMSQPVRHLGISAGKFENNNAAPSTRNLQDLLKNHQKRDVKQSPPLTRPAGLSTIQKFEIKSPKVMTKEQTKVEPNTAEHLRAYASFAGDNAIMGLKTLRHWIAQLLAQLSEKLEADSKQNRRAPTEIVLQLQQLICGVHRDVSNRFPIDDSDADAIMQVLKESEGFLRPDGSLVIQHPITHLKVVPAMFEDGKVWREAVGSEKALKEPKNEENLQDDDDEEFEELAGTELSQLSDDDDQSPSNDFVSSSKREASPAYDAMGDSDSEEVPLEDPPVPGPSYMRTYAEFQPNLVPVELLNPKEPCMECGKMIAKLEMLSHLDHHLAFQIANEQREEYRKQQKPSTPRGDGKKVLKKKDAPSKPKVNSIANYAVKVEVPAAEAENAIKCEQCGKAVASGEFVSHLDHHFAQKLRDEDIKKSAHQMADKQRKRPGSTQKNLPKMKSMKSYFATS